MILATAGGTASTIYTVVMVVVLLALMYFMMIRPQQKETKRKNQMLAEMAVSDADGFKSLTDIAREKIA